MPSNHLRRLRRNNALALGLGSALLLAACGPIFAAQTEYVEQSRKLEHLRDVNADARRDADRLRNEIEQMRAETTDRGLLLTLGEELFTTNDATLSSSGHYRLNALAGFLERNPQRAVAIDGHAGAGGYRYDLTLVKRRADAVKAHLIRQGIAPSRLTVRGNGAVRADDDSALHQPPVRRVEVTIEDGLTSVPRPAASAPGT